MAQWLRWAALRWVVGWIPGGYWARTSGCKRRLLSFSTWDLLVSCQMIKKLSIVNLPFQCAIMTSCLLCCSLTLDLGWFCGCLCFLRCQSRWKYRRNTVLIIDLCPCSRWSCICVETAEDLPGYCLLLCCKADCETKCQQVVHFIRIFSHGALEKYSKIHRVGEYNPWNVLLGQSKATQTGLHCPPPPPAMWCVKQCILHVQPGRDTRHIH